MAVAHDHAAVKPVIPRGTGRYHLQLRRKEILLFDAVAVLQNPEHRLFHLVLLCAGLGHAAHQHIQFLAFHAGCQRLFHLIPRQVNQQVGNAEDRVADIDTDLRAVFLYDNPVQGQRKRHPLVLLDAAVVMGIQEHQVRVLIQRILLHIQTGRVNMGAQNIHACFQRFLSDDKKRDVFSAVIRVYPVSRLQCPAGSRHILQIPVSGFLRLGAQLRGAFPLGLAGGEEFPVFFREIKYFLFLCFVIFFPCIWSCHDS